MDWIEWHGGEMPKELADKKVDIQFRSGVEIYKQDPSDWVWDHYSSPNLKGDGHIVKYKISMVH